MLNYAAVLYRYFTAMLMGLKFGHQPTDQIATPEILESAQLTQLLPPYPGIPTGIFICLRSPWQYSHF